MDFEYTPGPWSTIKPEGYGLAVFADSRPHIAVAIVGKGGRVSEERDANARLIAAAPELVELLIELEDAASVTSDSRVMDARRNAREVLRRISGVPA